MHKLLSNRPRSPVASNLRMKSVSSPREILGSKRTLRLSSTAEINRLEQNVVRSEFQGVISQESWIHRFPLGMPSSSTAPTAKIECRGDLLNHWSTPSRRLSGYQQSSSGKATISP